MSLLLSCLCEFSYRRVSTLSHIFPSHDALLILDIKNGAQCHVQLEFNLTPRSRVSDSSESQLSRTTNKFNNVYYDITTVKLLSTELQKT